MERYDLPRQAVIDGCAYPIRTDFRQILAVIRLLSDPCLPALFRFHGALALFYAGDIPPAEPGWRFLQDFIGAKAGGARRMDWFHDADAILADVSAVAGQDVREKEYLHWWSFLSLFHSVGPGQLSSRIAVREKLARGQKLERWEREYLQSQPDKVRLPPLESFEDRLARQALEERL